MNDSRVFTTVASVLALTCVVGAVVPAVGAWLDWAMRWVLGVAIGGPAAVWVVREVAGEIRLAWELRASYPTYVEPAAREDVEL